MTQPRWLILSGLLLAGCCNGSQPCFDPFLGRSTIPPPGTGFPGVVPGQPYYQGAPPPGAIAPPAGTSVPPANPYPQSSIDRAKPVRPGTHEYRVGRSAIARRSPVVTVEKDSALLAGTKASTASRNARPTPAVKIRGSEPVAVRAREPQRIVPSPRAVAITALPSRRLGAPATRAQSPASRQPGGELAATTAGQGPVDPVSSTQPAAPPAIARQTSRSAAKYGYDPQYKWLKGRLDYIQARKQWTLRYIPIDGQTDRYGGSVVIANGTEIEPYRPGNFVALQGSIESSDGQLASFAPLYRVERIKSLTD